MATGGSSATVDSADIVRTGATPDTVIVAGEKGSHLTKKTCQVDFAEACLQEE